MHIRNFCMLFCWCYVSLAQSMSLEEWLEEHEEILREKTHEKELAEWNHYTNITDENAALSAEMKANLQDYRRMSAEEAQAMFVLDEADPSYHRLLKKRQTIGIKLSPEETLELNSLVSNMTGVYGKASICAWAPDLDGGRNCSATWSINAEIPEIMSTSKDYDELLYVWRAWREAAGKPIKDTYAAFVKLSNKGARADNFSDTGAYWRSLYEVDNLEEGVEKMWLELLPMYEQLHAYIRRHLRERFGDRMGNKSSTIPAHLVGNIWAQTWENLFSWTAPYPDEPAVDVSEAMVANGYTPEKMFEVAEDFFVSMGLRNMTDKFWQYSVMEKPRDGREVVCQPVASDQRVPDDFRISICATVKTEDLQYIHHEMGHIVYFMSYENQSTTFREGANPGFQEAIGDTVGLAASTPDNLHNLGLLKENSGSEKQTLNFLYKQALLKVAFLPFGYLIDQWRWQIFDGTLDIDTDDVNKAWWDLRTKYQGISPPTPPDPSDFDAAAKYHVPANFAYMQYFISFVIQFQIYEGIANTRFTCTTSSRSLPIGLCKEAGHTGPLHECNFYGNKDAGAKFESALRKGASVHWSEVMKDLTGSTEMSAEPMVRYFAPLLKYLKQVNSEECFGWGQVWKGVPNLPLPRCEK